MSQQDWGSHALRAGRRSPKNKNRPAGYWIRPFLVTLAETGNAHHAARVVGISHDTVLSRKKRDPIFAAHFREAREMSMVSLEREARRRAVKGVEEPVFGNRPGKGHVKIGEIRKFSDTLLIFLMKAGNPKKYRDNYKVSIEGKVDHTHTHSTMKSILSDPEAVETATQLAKRIHAVQQQTPNQN